MTTRIPTDVQNAAINAVVDLADIAATPGVLRIFTGPQPASANDLETGTLLAEVPLGNPAFVDGVNGNSALAGTPLTTTGLADGDAGWFRVADGDDNAVFDGSAGTSGTELILNTTTISTGVDVQVTAGSIAMPSGE